MKHALANATRPLRIIIGAAIALCVLASLTTGAHAQWIYAHTADSSANFYGIDFPTTDVGYTVGWGNAGSLIRKTTDGGKTWGTQSFAGMLLFAAHFSNPDSGLVAGYLNSCNCGLIMRTTDGGANWLSGSTLASLGFYEFAFPTPDVGYLCGYNGAILKTTDGGINWSGLNTGTTDVFRSINFPTSDVGYAVAGVGTNFSQPGQIYKTTDAGATWKRIQDYTGARTIANIRFTSADVGFVVGHDGTEMIYKTTDGGATWRKVFTGGASDVLQMLVFSSPTTGYAGGTNGRILRTTDAGESWTLEQTGSDVTIIAGAAGGSSVYTAATAGVILKRGAAQSVPVSGVSADAAIAITPNPMGKSAIITPKSISAGDRYTFSLYDMTGHEVRRMEGTYERGGFLLTRDDLAAGAYLYRLRAGDNAGVTGTIIVR